MQTTIESVTFASNELLPTRGSTTTSSVLTRRNGVFGLPLSVPFNDAFLVLAFFADDVSLLNDNFRF